jgi:hypothetical protein
MESVSGDGTGFGSCHQMDYHTHPCAPGVLARLVCGEPTPTVDGKIYLARSPVEDNFPTGCARFEGILIVTSHKTEFWWSPQKSPDGRKFAGIQTSDIESKRTWR